ncbi:MAG TPA: hypothetical protein VF042_00910, partial [Gemmatimonadaceae bacterium]
MYKPLIGFCLPLLASAALAQRSESIDLVAREYTRLALAENLVDSEMVRNVEAPASVVQAARIARLSEDEIRRQLASLDTRASAIRATGLDQERLGHLRAHIVSL